MQKRLLFLAVMLIAMSLSVMAQVTTSSMSGKVMAGSETAIGATVVARHTPSGTVYRAITNASGLYTINGMRAGGPYEVTVTYIGFQDSKFAGLSLELGQNTVLNAAMSEDTNTLQEVTVLSSGGKNNMRIDRAGPVTSLNAERMAITPTVNRSMNDIMKLTPTGSTIGGFSVGGGNYRQSYVTVDGATFNNAFGIGTNLPGNGSPISLDALDQISVSTTPFDVRQSGFTGGSINAVTKSGTNDFKGSAYMYNTNVHLKGNKIGDVELERTRDHHTTYGVTLGGPIIKDKLFFFVNGEYEHNVSAGPAAVARANDTDAWGSKTGNVHRPTVGQLNDMSQYLQNTYGYNPGDYQDYSLEAPSYKILARLDWNINESNRVNLRFSRTHQKDSSDPSSSTSPLKHAIIYPGGVDAAGGRSTSGRTAFTAMYFNNQRYYQVRDFTSLAAEWNSKWGDNLSNTLRLTYSYQDEPREYDGQQFPTVDILDKGSVLASFGLDPFTLGNMRKVKTFVATDEANFTLGIHRLLAGVQFETNEAYNGYQQGGSGYYVFSSWNDFTTGQKPAAYAITFPRYGTSPFEAKMKYQQLSFYLQDQVNVSEKLRLTGGLRFELPMYPALKDNYNEPYAQLKFAGDQQFATDQLPKNALTVSPRIGFNWDVLGDQRLVVRGGTGYFVGRLPFVWLVSAVGNSNMGQIQYFYDTPSKAIYGQPNFDVSTANQIAQLSIDRSAQTAPQAPTIIDKNLKMNAAWKTSLAVDVRLPYDIDFSLEGLYSREFNPAVITNEDYYWDGDMVTLSPYDQRKSYKYVNKDNGAYYITNGGNKAYYYSITASLAKKFAFGLDLSASYTYAKAKSYGDGIGDQVSSAYSNNRYSINGINDQELGYGTYVAPHRLLISATYRKEYAKHFATTVGLVYEGQNIGAAGGYLSTRYSYTMASNVTNDGGANNLIRIPASREELNEWAFVEEVYNSNTGKNEAYKLNGQVYTADQQRDDFWAYVEQDDYLKNHKGEYAERGGVLMPWHHQLDFKFMQDFYIQAGKQRHTLQFGVDIQNLPNLLNKSWGLYKQVNTMSILNYDPKHGNAKGYTFQKSGGKRLTDTYSDYANYLSTYSILFSLRYMF